MNPEIKREWVAALRSGKYEQGDGELRDPFKVTEKFCCLGVLCDILKDRVGGHWDAGTFCVGDERDCMTLPEAVKNVAGLDSVDPVICDASLSAHNDGGPINGESGPHAEHVTQKSFPEIANLIERYL